MYESVATDYVYHEVLLILTINTGELRTHIIVLAASSFPFRFFRFTYKYGTRNRASFYVNTTGDPLHVNTTGHTYYTYRQVIHVIVAQGCLRKGRDNFRGGTNNSYHGGSSRQWRVSEQYATSIYSRRNHYYMYVQ